MLNRLSNISLLRNGILHSIEKYIELRSAYLNIDGKLLKFILFSILLYKGSLILDPLALFFSTEFNCIDELKCCLTCFSVLFIHISFVCANFFAFSNEIPLGIATRIADGGLTDILMCFARWLFSKDTRPMLGKLIFLDHILK